MAPSPVEDIEDDEVDDYSTRIRRKHQERDSTLKSRAEDESRGAFDHYQAPIMRPKLVNTVTSAPVVFSLWLGGAVGAGFGYGFAVIINRRQNVLAFMSGGMTAFTGITAAYILPMIRGTDE